MKKTKIEYVQGSLFEEDYLIRTLGSLAHSADIALTELVANAWDAGASKVDIIIPKKRGDLLVLEDDGIGLTPEEFHSRWMKLGYNRLKHQGNKVVFPNNKKGNRLAYGRNGIGRHGLLCFNNEYTVITRSIGKESTFIITTLSETEPFVIKEEDVIDASGNGVRLQVVVDRNLPDPARILETISA
jgi:HSP90 family molecular chaperone